MKSRDELMAEQLNDYREIMKKNQPETDAYKVASREFTNLCKLDVEETGITYNEYAREQQLDFDKHKFETEMDLQLKKLDIMVKELELKQQQFDRDAKWRLTPSANTATVCATSAALTVVGLACEANGIRISSLLKTPMNMATKIL